MKTLVLLVCLLTSAVLSIVNCSTYHIQYFESEIEKNVDPTNSIEFDIQDDKGYIRTI